MDTLASVLHTANSRVDYGMRRRAFAEWSLSADDWRGMTHDLVGRPINGKSPMHVDWADRKRLLASVWIWTRATQGEPHFAPLLRPDPALPKGGGDLSTYVHSRWPFITIGYGHYAGLRPRLDAHADLLARQIDGH